MRTLCAALLIVLAVGLVMPGCYVYGVDSEESFCLGKVVKVVDGDTYWIEWVDTTSADGGITSVRPYLIDCPEIYHRPPECYGANATQYCWNLLLDRYVWVGHYNRYSGDRLLAFIYLDGAHTLLLQTLLVAQGFAKADVRHPEEDELKSLVFSAEAQAKELHLGMGGRAWSKRWESDDWRWGTTSQEVDSGGSTANRPSSVWSGKPEPHADGDLRTKPDA